MPFIIRRLRCGKPCLPVLMNARELCPKNCLSGVSGNGKIAGYVAAVIMAQPKQQGRRQYLCESCNVLLSASDAGKAYRKAIAWGRRYESESIQGLKLLGIEVLHEIGEEIGDGVDISGCFFRKLDIWDRRDQLIPPPEELQAIRIAQNMNTPLGELLTPYQLSLMRQGGIGRTNG